MKPPAGAVVLVEYKPGRAPVLDGWSNKAWSARPDGSMMVDHPDKVRTVMNASAGKFGTESYHLHLEFKTSFMPRARGQARANAGCFHPPTVKCKYSTPSGLKGKPTSAAESIKTIRRL